MRLAARHLLGHLHFAVPAAAILALCLGAFLASFSVLHATLLRPLPYADPDRLVRIWETNAARGIHRSAVSRGNFADWRTMATSFEIIGAFSGPVLLVVKFGGGDPEIVRRAFGTDDFMRVMGVEPAVRNPEGGDQFLSHALWMRRFGGDPAAASGALVFEGHPMQIGGVMPRGFDFPAGADVWGLMSFGEERASRDVNVIARLRKDRTVEEARAELRTLAAALAAAHPAENAGWDVEIEPLQSTIVADATSTIWLLHAAVSLTLIIAVINVGGLFLAHAVARRREMAVRLALGAPARRLLGQQALEAALLVAAGTLGALAVGSALIQIMVSLAPPTLPRLHEIAFSAPAVYTAAVIAALMVALFTVVSARALRPDASELLAGQRAAGGPTARLGRGLLTVSQVAFCVVLLVLSSVVLDAFVKLLHADSGFVARGVLVAQVRQPVTKAGEVVKHYPTRRFARVADQLVDEALGLPGVEAAAVSLYPPMGRAGAPVRYLPLTGPLTGSLTGAPPVTGPDARPAIFNVVSPDYFSTFRVPILQGRPFTADDRLRDDQIDDRDAPRGTGVAIVNEAFVRQSADGSEVLGRFLAVTSASYRSVEIVGVVRDVQARPGEPAEPMIYLPFAQAPMATFRLFVRTAGEPAPLAGPLRERMRPFGDDVTAFDIRPLPDLVSELLAEQRFSSSVVAALGLTATVLSAAGLFSLLTFVAAQRRREFAIRLAIGATNGQVVRMVLRQGLGLAAVGIGCGIAIAAGVTGLVGHVLPAAVSPTVPLLAGVSGFVLVVALLAGYAPARQAGRVEPAIALRAEG